MATDILLTREGKQRLEEELERLRTTGRQELADRFQHALETRGELAENAEYLDVKEDQARLEQRIRDLEARLERASVVSPRRCNGTIDIGARVRLRDRGARRTEEYEIVGSGEGNPAAGRISRESPLASALLGRREGDIVEVDTPAGSRRLKVLAVR